MSIFVKNKAARNLLFKMDNYLIKMNIISYHLLPDSTVFKLNVWQFNNK